MTINVHFCDPVALSCPWPALPFAGAAARPSDPASRGGRIPPVELPAPSWEDLLGRR